VARDDVLGRFLARDVVTRRRRGGRRVRPRSHHRVLGEVSGARVESFQVSPDRQPRGLRDPRDLLKDATAARRGVVEIYRRMRPAIRRPSRAPRRSWRISFSTPRYDLSKVGRLKMNKKLGMEVPLEERVLRKETSSRSCAMC